jgi:hypothetical protein
MFANFKETAIASLHSFNPPPCSTSDIFHKSQSLIKAFDPNKDTACRLIKIMEGYRKGNIRIAAGYHTELCRGGKQSQANLKLCTCIHIYTRCTLFYISSSLARASSKCRLTTPVARMYVYKQIFPRHISHAPNPRPSRSFRKSGRKSCTH